MKLNKMNVRFLKEVKNLKNSMPAHFKLVTHNNTTLILDVYGAPSTIYSGEIFTLKIEINDNYPIDPPTAVFIKNIPENEHVYTNGHICISVLHDDWSPAMTLEMVVIAILSMLSDAKKKSKPPDNYFYTVFKRNKSPRDTKWVYHK
ncbi:hypothetical protein VCUG_02571 [Vavraia culicis subsp. floridensis]|uniref:UBC core domain-containing protein n=1 Tax=Vavraia culicis (isolate floridensis) TaxID=948595 RepID=L2GQQ4_VAVCU|nr:uncharacterized protein VCUG_02571 [Vavraia culicis subsp. floridensis]ELA45944.1 hypothetical protein VCUG_02571 [Vavraia culicis subsp. floridensis]